MAPITATTRRISSHEEPDALWQKLTLSLRSYCQRFVYAAHVPAWQGQEDEIAHDIVQETARRMFERSQKTQRGEAAPIHYFEPMALAVARNCCRDMKRHDRCLQRTDNSLDYPTINQCNIIDLEELATEHAYQQALFSLLAQEIANFPAQQRRVLLTDLANRMCFEPQRTPLQKAFEDVGINLQAYQQTTSPNAKQRQKDATLLSYAYKRITRLTSLQQYTANRTASS